MSAIAVSPHGGLRGPVIGLLAVLAAGMTAVLGAVLLTDVPAPPCVAAADGGLIGSAAIALAAGAGEGAGPVTVGATEYGGPGDPSSGTIGSSGQSLTAHPDSYAELGGPTFDSATALGGLPYLTPLRITWGQRSAIALKRDIGLGGGPIDGHPRAIDLWWQFAGGLGIPYEAGRWSGTVRVARVAPTGSSALLGAGVTAPVAAGSCALEAAVAPVVGGSRATLLRDGLAAAPARAPAAVRGIIAAGNAIAGRPYVYGAAHGLPLDEIAPAYDCSSSVEHLLYGGGLLPVDYGAASSALETWGEPGPGRWVTIYANPDHVFLYVAGLRWDTWNAAGPGDGTTGIGWHPLVREASGFVARHPAGL